MKLKIEAASIANGLLALVAAPQWRNVGAAVGTGHARAPIRFLGHISGRLREGPIGVVVLVIETAGIT